MAETHGRPIYYYTVSHLNHIKLPRNLERTGASNRAGNQFSSQFRPSLEPTFRAHSDVFTLEEQIQHKKDFCTEYLPKKGKLFVFGHSIGCYMALRLLPFLKSNGWNLIMAYPLYPAIERLMETVNGARIKPIAEFMCRHKKLTRVMFAWLKVTPAVVKRCIVRACLRPYGKSPECIIKWVGRINLIKVSSQPSIVDLEPERKR